MHLRAETMADLLVTYRAAVDPFAVDPFTELRSMYPTKCAPPEWHPHSIVGNGNKGDESLDGFMGKKLEHGVRVIL